ncbi:PREDICTED: tetraspanin-8-like [Ipomoea nil]|uniref:tetraspanin-8-like n=1 Tax=Ipomoea nil TaxID=35883 RepID=UPI0009009F5E|nr:PREDICTED: tetraspanin-8-like [Ipomoea nil]
MVRVSNAIIGFLNLLTLLLGVVAIGMAVWIQFNPSASLCQKVLQKPFVILGLSLLFVSMFGLIGSCFRISFFLWVYLTVMFFLILGIFCFLLFTIIVTNKGVGNALSGKGYKAARLGDYSHWLQKYVLNAQNWDQIKSCLHDIRLCQSLSTGKSADYYKHSLSPTQSGCCKPPSYCGFEFHNATYWTMPKGGPAVPHQDCNKWSNDQTELCFDCESCKTAVLESLRKDWKKLAIINVCILAFVILVYSVGCCALRSNRSSRYDKYKGGFYP